MTIDLSCCRVRGMVVALLLSLGPVSMLSQNVPLPKGAPAPNRETGARTMVQSQARPRKMQSTPLTRLMEKMAAAKKASGKALTKTAAPMVEEGSAARRTGFVEVPYTVARRPRTDTDYSLRVEAAVTADFNGDGKPDIANVQAGDGYLNVFISPASGDFTSTGLTSSVQSLEPNSNIPWAQAIDIDGDGDQDVVTFDDGGWSYGGAVNIFLNDGTGNFTPTKKLLSSSNISGYIMGRNAAVGDVNGDGKPDVVVQSAANILNDNYSTDKILIITQVYLNAGDGTLQDPLPEFTYASYPTNESTPQNSFYTFELADMNRDGKLDLVSVLARIQVDPYVPNTHSWATVQVQLGNGDGTFAPLPPDAETTATFRVPFAQSLGDPGEIPSMAGNIGNLTVLDINGDGYPDAVLGLNYGLNYNEGSGDVYVGLGKGDGTFNPPYPAVQSLDPSFRVGVNVADVNSDNKSDLLVYSYGGVAIYPGNGDGTFPTQPVSQYVTGYTYGLRPTPADFNDDGKVDFVDVGLWQNKMALYAGNGDGTFRATPLLSVPGENASNFEVVATGDFLGNGKIALLGLDYAHMNADGYPDIFVASQDGTGDLTYTKGIAADILTYARALYIEPVTGDFNADGAADLIIPVAGGLSIAYSHGDGTFTEPMPVDLGTSTSCGFNYADVGDISRDGLADIVIAYAGDSSCSDGTAVPAGVFTLLSNGDGTFQSTLIPYGHALYQPKLIDLNNDSALDLVLVDSFMDYDENWNTVYHFETSILAGLGNGRFVTVAPVTALKDYQVTSIIAGDFNGDGKQDLTLATEAKVRPDGWPEAGPGAVLVAGHGDFTFEDPVPVAPGHTAAWGSYGDFNGDGFPDLVLGGLQSVAAAAIDPDPNLAILINNGDGTFGTPHFPYMAEFLNLTSAYTFVTDVNDDGSQDVVITGSNNSAVFLNTGGTRLALAATPSSILLGQTVTLTANLSSSVSGDAPQGTITFLSDGAEIGSAPITDGMATFSTGSLTAGTHTLKAVYPGDETHNSMSATVVVTVTAITPSFTMTAGSSSLVLTQGTSGSVALSLSANETFDGVVQFSCAGAPEGGSCTITPSSLTLTPGQTGTATVNISAGSALSARNATRGLGLQSLGALAFVAGLITLVPSRRGRTKILSVVVLALVLGSMGMMTACGGNSSERTVSPPPVHSTLTITATSGSITHTQSIALTINYR